MSTNTTSLARVGAIIGIAVGIFGVITSIGALFVIPYRVDAAEKKQVQIEGRMDKSDLEIRRVSEAIIRIDEYIKETRRLGKEKARVARPDDE